MTLLTATDFLCLLICGLFALTGYRRGAINSLIKFGGFMASFIMARLFSPILAESLVKWPLFRTFIDQLKIDAMVQTLGESLGGEGLAGHFYRMGENPLIQQSADGLTEALFLVIGQFISFGLIIIVVSMIIRLLQTLFRGIDKVPVIGGINRLLGLGLGLIIGLGFCFLLVWIFSLIDLYKTEALNWLNYQNSYFYQRVVGYFLTLAT